MIQKHNEPLGRLGVLVVVVALVLSSALAGVAFAATVQRGGVDFNPGVGGPNDVQITADKPVVFQGEENVDLLGTEGQPIDASQLVGVAGDAEGVPLELPVPRDQERGQYAINGQADQPGVTVQTPRVTDLELLNQRGIDVEGASVQEDEVILSARSGTSRRPRISS
jgi:hypothetical protein